MSNEDGAETSQLGEDLAVAGSPLKLHDYLADLQLPHATPLSSNIATVSRRPISLKDAR